MVTHEFTVFPDGHVDGEAAARSGDRKSHTLHFVLAHGLTASAAKLLLWPAGETIPTQYDQSLTDADEVSFTPTAWAGAGITTAQLELLNDAGDIAWQSRRFAIPVEAGIPDETLPPLFDSSDATAEAGDVRLGKTFYAKDGKKTGAHTDPLVAPVYGWSALPIQYIKGKCNTSGNQYYFQRVRDKEFWLVFPEGDNLTDFDLTISLEAAAKVYRGGALAGEVDADGIVDITGEDFSEAQELTIMYGDDYLQSATIKVWAMTETAQHACLEASFTRETGSEVKLPAFGNGAVSYCVRFSTGAGDITLNAAGAYARISQNGRMLYSSNIDMTGGFAQVALLSPDGIYRKTYAVTWTPEASGNARISINAYPAVAAIDKNTDFYDYEGNGFALCLNDSDLPDIEDVATSLVYNIADNLDVMGFGTRLENGRIPLSFCDYPIPVGASTSIVSVIKTFLADETEYEVSCSTRLYAVEGLTDGAVTAGSRWMVFINGEPLEVPRLNMLFAAPGMKIDLVYTCADGCDIGWPGMGA